MKINLLVDAAYAFDYISILELKHNKHSNHTNRINYLYCKSNLECEFGIKLLDEILQSKEYSNLYEANSKTFDLVDMAKKDLCYASEVDKANYERYLAKAALQKKFFGDNVSEVKIGY